MKKIIIILGTIILGVYIVSTLIMGTGNGSLKGNADSIVQRGTTVITDTLLTVEPKK